MQAVAVITLVVWAACGVAWLIDELGSAFNPDGGSDPEFYGRVLTILTGLLLLEACYLLLTR